MVTDLVVYRERIYLESILQELPSERSRLSKCVGLDNNDPPICKALFAQNGTCQYPVWITQKPRKTDLIKGVKIQKISGPGANFRLGESSAKRNFASLGDWMWNFATKIGWQRNFVWLNENSRALQRSSVYWPFYIRFCTYKSYY